jgi:hypothetical protein
MSFIVFPATVAWINIHSKLSLRLRLHAKILVASHIKHVVMSYFNQIRNVLANYLKTPQHLHSMKIL